jgi:hypothetical protein
MYSNEYKGHLPPDLAGAKPYLGEGADASVARLQEDYVYAVQPGTRIVRIKSPGQHPVLVQKAEPGESILILFADGHVGRFTPAPAAPRGGGRAPENAAAQPAEQGILGAWQTTAGLHDARYQFNADGTFTLEFTPSAKLAQHQRQLPQTRPAVPPQPARAGGTWRIEGKRLVMTNTSSTTPFTVVGEREEAELVSVGPNDLVLRTTDNRGQPEDVRLVRRTPFEKGKRDDQRIVGTWRSERLTLVIADSGLAAMLGAKGEWSQGGNHLAIKVTSPGGVAPRTPDELRAIAATDLDFTIDHLDETTLVMTGDLFGTAHTLLLLRVK